MAKRTELLGISEIDNHGGLDFFIWGSQWLEWFKWRRKIKSDKEIKIEILEKFELCLDRAFKMGK